MNDVEDRLSRYQPAGPPAELRARAVGLAGASRDAGHGSWWPWLPAAVAAAVAIVFHALSARASADSAVRLDAPDRARAVAVADLAAQLGGDPLAIFEAQRLIDSQDVQPDPAPDTDAAQVTSHD